MSNLQAEKKYCTFIDVLGYKDIVQSQSHSQEEKIQMLEDLYGNLQNSISAQLKWYKYADDDKLFVKSFSDCLYLESKSPFPILFALHNSFNNVFGYNTNFPEKKTPMLRSGTVRDWTLRIMDLGSLTRQPLDTMYKNEEYSNVIGSGVAEAYLTSEKSKLSGMRIILRKDTFDEIELNKYEKVSFSCFYADCPNFMTHEELPKTQKPVRLYFLPITENEKEEPADLFELCWPVFDYSWSKNKSDILTRIEALLRMRNNFNADSIRHLRKTAELILKALIISYSLYPDDFNREMVMKVISELQEISNTDFSL